MGATVEKTMAKAKAKGKKSERDDVAVKIDRTIVGKARHVAIHQGISVAELLSGMLGAPVDRAYAQMLRDLEARGGPK